MANPRPPLTREHIGILVVALLLTAWGGSGLYEGLNSGFSGGLYDPEYRVPEVHPGGRPTDSGFKAGDRIVSVEGRPVETLGMESRWPRALVPRIGESRRFVVRRGDEEIPIDVVFPAPFPAAVANRIRPPSSGSRSWVSASGHSSPCEPVTRAPWPPLAWRPA